MRPVSTHPITPTVGDLPDEVALSSPEVDQPGAALSPVSAALAATRLALLVEGRDPFEVARADAVTFAVAPSPASPQVAQAPSASGSEPPTPGTSPASVAEAAPGAGHDADAGDDAGVRVPHLTGRHRKRGRRLVAPVPAGSAPAASGAATGMAQMTPQQRLLVLDTWSRSGLPAGDFAPLVGVSKHTLYAWKARFEAQGPAGLMDGQRGSKPGSRLPELTKRTILMLKQAHAEWGTQRISDELARGPGLAASASAIGRVLHEAGYEFEERTTSPHPDKVRSFERAAPNQLWQSDLFTFMLKRQNQRVHLVAFLDDHSRFIVSYGLHASQSAALVIETFRAGIASYGAPQEMLTDNGAQYVTWRGTSAFAKECQVRGVKQIVATPRHPQTLGKTERFWGTLWREFLEVAVFADLTEARTRVGHFIDHYNFQRPHQGIGGLVPADRFFAAAPAVRSALAARLAANALELARGGVPKPPLYLAGNLGGAAVTLHGEGDALVLTHGGTRTSIALAPPASARPVPVPAALTAAGPVLTGQGIAPGANREESSAPTTPTAESPSPDRVVGNASSWLPSSTAMVASVPPMPMPMPTPLAPCAEVRSPWTGASVLPPGRSALDDLVGVSNAAESNAPITDPSTMEGQP